jgi:LDH2 family malate/lactate/ureidoglycolate dehydrogenase
MSMTTGGSSLPGKAMAIGFVPSIRSMRASLPAPGTSGPSIPGDPEREAEAVRRVEGIPLVPKVIEELRLISRETGVPFD